MTTVLCLYILTRVAYPLWCSFPQGPVVEFLEMGSSTDGKVAGVVIFDDPGGDEIAAIEWASPYVDMFMKNYKLKIIHVAIEGRDKYTSPTEHDIDWIGIQDHFEKGEALDKFQLKFKLYTERINLRFFKGNDRKRVLQRAFNDCLPNLQVLVLLGWPKQKDGEELQKISVTTGCIIVVVPKKDASVTMDYAPAVVEPPASSESAATPLPLENHSHSGDDGGSVRSRDQPSSNNNQSGEGSSTVSLPDSSRNSPSVSVPKPSRNGPSGEGTSRNGPSRNKPSRNRNPNNHSNAGVGRDSASPSETPRNHRSNIESRPRNHGSSNHNR